MRYDRTGYGLYDRLKNPKKPETFHPFNGSEHHDYLNQQAAKNHQPTKDGNAITTLRFVKSYPNGHLDYVTQVKHYKPLTLNGSVRLEEYRQRVVKDPETGKCRVTDRSKHSFDYAKRRLSVLNRIYYPTNGWTQHGKLLEQFKPSGLADIQARLRTCTETGNMISNTLTRIKTAITSKLGDPSLTSIKSTCRYLFHDIRPMTDGNKQHHIRRKTDVQKLYSTSAPKDMQVSISEESALHVPITILPTEGPQFEYETKRDTLTVKDTHGNVVWREDNTPPNDE
jgi:hypothetical protein